MNPDNLPLDSLPRPPQNVFADYSTFLGNTVEIIWGDPSQNMFNSHFTILGVNVYRSLTEDLGPYIKLNDAPIEVGFYADSAIPKEVTENVSESFIYRGDGPSSEWVFELKEHAVKKEDSYKFANTQSDIQIWVDGVEVPCLRVDGERKQVLMVSAPYWEKKTRSIVEPVLPKQGSVVLCTYYTNKNLLGFKLGSRSFYKVTTVSTEGESPLEWSTPVSHMALDTMDYIWIENRRRNRWILEREGERCKVMVRKWAGERCSCTDPTYGRSPSTCKTCYGTGFVGGYEGPFDFLMAPVDSNQTIRRTDKGLKLSKDSELWSNLSPMLKTFDLILRKNGELFIVGDVHPAETRGNCYLQQTFSAGLLSRDRIEYQIEFFTSKKQEQVMITDKHNVPDGQEVKGRTIVFENINY